MNRKNLQFPLNQIPFSFVATLERVCTLNGTREGVNHAKELIQQLCAQHNASGGIETVSCVVVPPSGNAGYPPYQEVMVPGSKVGLVIGKGGETIKNLQEKSGAKMVIIQDGPGQELVVKYCRIRSNWHCANLQSFFILFFFFGKKIRI